MLPKLIRHFTYMIAVILTGISLPGCGETTTDIEYLARAKNFQDESNYQASIIELKNALAFNPNNLEARWMLGKNYLEVEQGPYAEKELLKAKDLGLPYENIVVPLAKALLIQGKFDEVININADAAALDKESSAKIAAIKGHAYLGLDEEENAKQAYASAQSINPEEAEAYLGLARLSILESDLAAARLSVGKVIEVSPTFADAWSLLGDIDRFEGKVADAELAYGKAIELQNEWNHKDRIKRALVRIYMEKFDEAKSDIETIRRIYPKHAGADYAQGLIFFHQEKYEDARTAFENALAINKNYMPAMYYLGVVHYLNGNYNMAYNYMLQHEKLHPRYIPTQQLLAILEMQTGDYDQARQRINPLLVLMPDDLVTLKLMSQIAIAQGNSEEATTYARMISSQKPDSVTARINLGMGLLIEGETDQGILELKKAIEVDKDSVLAEFSLVVGLISQNKLDAALDAAIDFGNKHPDSTMALNLQALVLLKMGQVENAKKLFKEVLEKVPGQPTATKNLAMLELRGGNISKAIEMYENVLRNRPGHVPSIISLAMLKSRQGRNDEVEDLFITAIKARPDALEPRVLLADWYARSGNPSRAIEVLSQVQETYKDHPAFLVAIARVQSETGATSSAIDTLRRLSEISPTAEVYLKLAQAYEKARDINNYGDALQNAVKADPRHLASNIELIRFYVLQNRMDEAQKTIDMLEKAYPDNPLVFEQKGDFALTQKHPDIAMDAYIAAMKKTPSSKLLIKLSLAMWQTGKNDESIKLLERHLDVNPGDALVRFNLANFYLLSKQTEKAIQAYSKVVEANPNHVVALNNLAWLSRKTNPGEARSYGDRALKLAPDNPDVMDTFAMLLVESNEEYPRAVDLLEQAKKLSPDNKRIRYHLAIALNLMGEKERARKELDLALADNQSFAEREGALKLQMELRSQ